MIDLCLKSTKFVGPKLTRFSPCIRITFRANLLYKSFSKWSICVWKVPNLSALNWLVFPPASELLFELNLLYKSFVGPKLTRFTPASELLFERNLLYMSFLFLFRRFCFSSGSPSGLEQVPGTRHQVLGTWHLVWTRCLAWVAGTWFGR
jgi:hypothetical protein